MNNEYAEIVLPLPVSGSYTYFVPSDLRPEVVPGCRVVVPFGKKRNCTGVVVDIHSEKPTEFEAKPVLEVLHGHTLNKRNLDLLRWISSYYLTSPGEVLKAAMPSSLMPSGRSTITLSGIKTDVCLNDDEQWLLDILYRKNSVFVDKLPERKDGQSIIKIVSSLLEKGLITTAEEVHEETQAPDDMIVVLATMDDQLKNLSRAPRQKALLETFFKLSENNRKVRRSDLLREACSNTTVLNSLTDKGILSLEPYYNQESGTTMIELPHSPLSQIQSDAFNSIRELFNDHAIVLLHGVTSSGKTEIYVHLIEEQLKRGKQVLYMLPEIALTTQIIERLRKHFGERIGIFHSRMSSKARLKVWEKVASDNPETRLNLVLGVRSSVFLPFSDLGLIIVDEEHDPSYKQYDPAPRYNARDTAMILSRIHGARTLLGSATPSVESYYNAVSGKYGLVSLTSRFGDVKLPEIILSDMRYLRRNKTNALNYSKPLIATLEEALGKNEQAMLFQNRRGFTPFITCGECGWVHGCSDCSVSFTYHKRINKMVCHYCGKTESPLTICPVCGSSDLRTMGLGTEKIEEEIKTIFPSASVARMDQDTTRAKGAHSMLLSDFAEGQTDILIGTQMISKGLDFENLTVVGILDADSMLNYPDFRANERSFQMMEQVSGRAGRRNKRGKVIIQTSNPAHIILRQVIKHDYRGMYENQIAERKEFGYPPFTRLIQLSLKHGDKDILDKISHGVAIELRKHLGPMVLGPEYPPVSQVQKWFIKDILIKIKTEISATKVKDLIMAVVDKTLKANGSSLRISIDVDPQ